MLKQLILVSTLLITASTQAQFSKYKSKTRFNKENSRDDQATQNKSFSPPKRTYLGSNKKSNDQSSDANNKHAPVRSLLNKVADEQKQSATQDRFNRKIPKPTLSPQQEKAYVNLNPETAFGPEVVTSFDFPNADIGELIKHMQQLTGINMIYEKNLKGKSKVSISAPTPITVGDAWRAFLTALNINELSLVKTGAFYKIVPISKIKNSPSKIYTGSFSPDTENLVMRIIPLKNINGKEVKRSLRQFLTRNGKISNIDQTNTVIVQDIGTNVNRIARLIKFIDIPGHEESMEIIPVRHSSAPELAKLLEQLIQDKSSSKFRTSSAARSMSKDRNVNIRKIIAETRTNSIIAMANAAGAKKLRTLIAQLDVKVVASGAGKIHVYYLNHSDAEAMGKSLSSLVGGTGSSRSKRSSKFSRGSSNSTDNIFNDTVKITADKSNNALVITASPTDYLTIKDVISKLDVPKDQVFVEGLIMETKVDKISAFGISIVGAYGTGGAQRAGFTGGSSDLMSLLTGNITNLSGLFIGSGSGGTVTDSTTGAKINTVNALLTAIATNSHSNVLATPQILALDNEEAVFEVGETVPVSEQTNASNGSTTSSVKQQKIALVLKITPQINKQSKVIKLKIDQKVEDFSNRALPEGGAGGGVATTTRSAVTTVLCKDRDTIAMGGLMRDKEINTLSKVPLLGDIPLVGWLFKHTQKSVSKVNMLFFLTPKIVSINNNTPSNTVKDLLNRRNSHLKGTFKGKDPHASIVKGLYHKTQNSSENELPED